jgi:hypothetical protein
LRKLNFGELKLACMGIKIELKWELQLRIKVEVLREGFRIGFEGFNYLFGGFGIEFFV